MVTDFNHLSTVTVGLIEAYKEGLRNKGEFTGKLSYLDDTDQHPVWFQDFFSILDQEIDHREEAICDTADGKIDYLGQTGLPKLLNIRQYIVVIRAKTGIIVLDYTTSSIKDPSVRSVRIITGDSVYLVRNDRDHIIDYPFELLA